MLCDHNKGQGHLRSPGEKGQTKKFRDLELRYMFLGQIFTKNAKNDRKTLFKASKSVKKQNSENHGKVAKWRESACFLHVLCYISDIFEDIDLKFCTHIHETLPSNILYGFLKILILRGKILKRKEKCWKFWNFLEIFKILKIRDSSFVALLILRHFI